MDEARGTFDTASTRETTDEAVEEKSRGEAGSVGLLLEAWGVGGGRPLGVTSMEGEDCWEATPSAAGGDAGEAWGVSY